MDNFSTTLPHALDSYDLKRLSNRAPRTRRMSQTLLKSWADWVTEQTQPNVYLVNVDDTLMSKYFNQYRPPAYRANTFNLYRSLINGFWTYCLLEDWVRVNPMRFVESITAPERVRLRLAAEELLTMVEGTESPRDRAALAIGANTALRAQDICALKINAVNLHDNTLTAYIHKTSRVEIIGITAELREEMLRWFAAYAELLGLATYHDLRGDYTLIPPLQALAQSDNRGFITRPRPYGTLRNPHQIVQRALVRMGLPIADDSGKSLGEGFHTLRRSVARVAHDTAEEENRGSAIRAAQVLLGHKTQTTTERYLGITHDKKVVDEMMRGRPFLTRAAERDKEKNETLDATAADTVEYLARRRHA